MTVRPIDRVCSRLQLLGLRYASGSKSKVFVNDLAALGLLRYRGKRAGAQTRSRQVRTSVYKHDPVHQPSLATFHPWDQQYCRPLPSLRSIGNGAAVVTGNRPYRRRRERCPSTSTSLREVPIVPQRHTRQLGRYLAFACMNVRSLSPTKLDDLLVEFHDSSPDVMLLCETWHDADSVAIRRLRADGFSVVERARPRTRRAAASLDVNHGGVAVVAAAGVRLKRVDVGSQPSTFECVAARVSSGPSSCVVVVVYRPGSSAVTSAFFAELADVLDYLSTFADPVVLAGDVNIRLERTSDPDTIEFNDLVAGYGLTQLVRGPTHDKGGTLDVVCVRDDLPTPTVDVVDVGLSDHRLLRWSSCLLRPPPVYVTSTRRSWRSFDHDAFTADLRQSALCDDQRWNELDGDGLMKLYDDTIVTLLDRQVPFRTTTCRRRPSTAWYDDDCRQAKRSLRSSERSARRAGLLSDTTSPAVATWRAERRRYFDLIRQKRTDFWTARIEDDKTQPRRLWQSFDQLLGRGRAPPTDIDATVLHQYFDDKVAGVREATAGAEMPQFTPAPAGCELRIFTPVTPTDVIKMVRALPDKQCSSDPLPTWLLKKNIEVLAPFLSRLICWSLEHGVVPSAMKSAYITPVMKKADMDPADTKSYRPISNLSVMSKLLERFVSKQLLTYLTDNRLLPDRQSAYRAFHSTETAVLKVLADILLALDSGDLAALTLLDLSAAFDSVDHETLLRRLQASYGLDGIVKRWFTSYLSGRTQYVRSSTSSSGLSAVLYGVPQGSVLGPILFLLYTADVFQLIKRHQLESHGFADDTQIYGFCHPSDTSSLQERLSVCIDDVTTWTTTNRLLLNPNKTEVLWCSSTRRQHQLPTGPVRVGSTTVLPVSVVRDLGVYIDTNVTMRAHVTATVRTCFMALRQIRSVRRSLSRDALLTLIRALVISKADYCCSVLTGVSGTLLHRLQSVFNAAARLVFSTRTSEHITPLLRELHWLKVPERIQFRLCVLTYRCLNGTAPPYLADTIQPTTDVDGRRCLRSGAAPTLVVPPTRRSTLGDRAFPAAATRAWNALPSSVRTIPSLMSFRRELKSTLFNISFSGSDM